MYILYYLRATPPCRRPREVGVEKAWTGAGVVVVVKGRDVERREREEEKGRSRG